MFKCENSSCKLKNNLVPPRQPINTIVVEKRPHIYENKIRRGKHKGKMKRTEGWEIAKEIQVCPECYEKLTGEAGIKARPDPKPPKISSSRPRFKDRPPKKKWQNPRKKKGMKAKNSTPPPEKKKPVVEVINRAKK